MKKNLIISGGIFHPFEDSSKTLSTILDDIGYESLITTDIEGAFKNLKDYDLLTINALRWRMLNHEKYLETKAKYNKIKYLYRPNLTIIERMEEVAKSVDPNDPLLKKLEEEYPKCLLWIYNKVILYRDIVKKFICLLLIGTKNCGKSSIVEALVDFVNVTFMESKRNNHDIECNNPKKTELLVFNDIDWKDWYTNTNNGKF